MINLYSTAKLANEKSRLERLVQRLYTEIFQGVFTPEERLAFQGIEIISPEKGAGKFSSPMAFYAKGNQVVIPILSLLFWEDLCTAYAWLHQNRYNLDTIDEYVAMLKYVPGSAFDGGQYPLPLEALHIPAAALTDPEVDDLFFRLHVSGIAFILAHEMVHVFYRHIPDLRFGAKNVQDQEKDADAYALNLLKRVKIIPMDAFIWFQACAYHLPNRGDFRTDWEWNNYLNQEALHPVTSDRLKAMAAVFQQQADRFLNDGDDIEGYTFIANGMLQIAEILEDTDLQRLMAEKRVESDRAT